MAGIFFHRFSGCQPPGQCSSIQVKKDGAVLPAIKADTDSVWPMDIKPFVDDV